MKKTNIILCIVCLCIFFVSCRSPKKYDFLQPKQNISHISIVEISFSEEHDIIQSEVQSIKDIKSFFNDFGDIDSYYFWIGDPKGVTIEGVDTTAVKISYINGEYELINWNGQSKYTLEKGLTFYAGFIIFDETQFKALVDKYDGEQN